MQLCDFHTCEGSKHGDANTCVKAKFSPKLKLTGVVQNIMIVKKRVVFEAE